MLKGYSSKSLNRTNRLDHALSDEQVRVGLRSDRGIARDNVTRPVQPGLEKSGFTPDRANGDGNGLPEHRAWLAVFFLEGCAVSAVLLHPEAAFPYKDFPVRKRPYQKAAFCRPRGPSLLPSFQPRQFRSRRRSSTIPIFRPKTLLRPLTTSLRLIPASPATGMRLPRFGRRLRFAGSSGAGSGRSKRLSPAWRNSMIERCGTSALQIEL